jgi:hypothetical protein
LFGHGAGGQFVTRYVAFSNEHSDERVHIDYVASNPSTYMYLSEERPVLPASLQNLASDTCAYFNSTSYAQRAFEFKPAQESQLNSSWLATLPNPPDVIYGDDCSKFDEYPWSTGGTQRVTELKDRISTRSLVLMPASLDACNYKLQGNGTLASKTNPVEALHCGYCCNDVAEEAPGPDGCTSSNGDLDLREAIRYPTCTVCQCMAQGSTRVERAYAYWSHLKKVFGKSLAARLIPVHGRHDACEIAEGLPAREFLFKNIVPSSTLKP